MKIVLRKAEQGSTLAGEEKGIEVRASTERGVTTYTVAIPYNQECIVFKCSVPAGEPISDFGQIQTLSIDWPCTENGQEFPIPEDKRRGIYAQVLEIVSKKTQPLEIPK